MEISLDYRCGIHYFTKILKKSKKRAPYLAFKAIVLIHWSHKSRTD